MFYVLCLHGSARKRGNTELLVDYLCEKFREAGVSVEKLNLCKLEIKPCTGCRYCARTGKICAINDDMRKVLIPRLIKTDGLILASPVYFNNVSACVKLFIDRTWCLKGKLKDIVGGAVVVGRGYGAELAIAAIHAFMLKHEMVVGFRGVTAFGFERGDVARDKEAFKLCDRLVKRMLELLDAVKELRSSVKEEALKLINS